MTAVLLKAMRDLRRRRLQAAVHGQLQGRRLLDHPATIDAVPAIMPRPWPRYLSVCPRPSLGMR